MRCVCSVVFVCGLAFSSTAVAPRALAQEVNELCADGSPECKEMYGYRETGPVPSIVNSSVSMWNSVWNILPLRFLTTWLSFTPRDTQALFGGFATQEQQDFCRDVAEGKYSLEERMTIGYEQYKVGLADCVDGQYQGARVNNIFGWFLAVVKWILPVLKN